MSRNFRSDANPAGYLARGAQQRVVDALDDTPVVCLLGPRQCGKSTLVAHLAPDRYLVDLDDATLCQLAQDDPQGFLADLPPRVTIDEVQRAPGLTLAIKRSVDQDRRPGRFLLTGSANLLQLPALADSLAGRMEIVRLHPLTESEKALAPGRFLDQWLSGYIRPVITGS